MFGFSWKRVTGVTKVKQTIAKATGVPTTKAGRKRKVEKIVASPITSLLFGKKKKRK